MTKYVSICVDWEHEVAVDRRVFDTADDAINDVFDELRSEVAANFDPDDPDHTQLMLEIDAMKFIERDDGVWVLEADDCRYVIAPIDA